MLEAELVLVTVVLVNFTPVSSNVANEVGEWVVPGCPECFQNTRSGQRPSREKNECRSLGLLELPVFYRVADVSVDPGSVDLVSLDLATSEFRDEHRGIHGAILSGEIAELLEESALYRLS